MSTQAEYSDGGKLYGVDLDNLVEAHSNDGVLTGWTLVQNATPNMSVDVAAGTGFSGGVYNTTVSTTNVVITASHASLDRLDIIVVNNAGTISAIAGTPAASPNPPDLPDNNICLAIIVVDATVTAIYDADIISRRLLVGGIKDEHIASTLAWDKISKTGSNLSDLATKSHTVLTDKGTNTHPQIDTHLGDSSDPHGSSMTVSVKIETPLIQQTGNIVIESTTGNITLSPSGRVYIDDGLEIKNGSLIYLQAPGGAIQGQFQGSATTFIMQSNDVPLEFKFGSNLMFEIKSNALEFAGPLHPVIGCNYDLGTLSLRWDQCFLEHSVDVGSCDVAEWMPGKAGEPGDVYILNDNGLLIHCEQENDSRVIGVFTTDPGLMMGYRAHRLDMSDERWRETNVPVGLLGVVPTKVIGTVYPSDYLITSNEKGKARSIRKGDKPPFYVLGRATTKQSEKDKMVMVLIENQVLYHHPMEEAA